MITVKLSYSILSNWADFNRQEDAVAAYLGKDLPPTPYMELGKLKHEYWAKYILRTKQLPPELGGGKIKNPIVEQKYQKLLPFSDDIQILLRGAIDLEDTLAPRFGGGVQITDHKCGLGRPSKYVDGMQLDYYKLLRPQATRGRYICHDPYKCEALCQKRKDGLHSCYSTGIKYLDRTNAENALNHIYTYGGEFISYLQVNKLLIDYTPQLTKTS